MMQVYVKGSVEAVALYQKAFGATLVAEYKNGNGSYDHAELDVFGQIVALSETQEGSVTGNVMQFCLHLGEGKEGIVKKAYDVLKDNARIDHPPGPVGYSPCQFVLIDKFGVNWCVFV